MEHSSLDIALSLLLPEHRQPGIGISGRQMLAGLMPFLQLSAARHRSATALVAGEALSDLAWNGPQSMCLIQNKNVRLSDVNDAVPTANKGYPSERSEGIRAVVNGSSKKGGKHDTELSAKSAGPHESFRDAAFLLSDIKPRRGSQAQKDRISDRSAHTVSPGLVGVSHSASSTSTEDGTTSAGVSNRCISADNAVSEARTKPGKHSPGTQAAGVFQQMVSIHQLSMMHLPARSDIGQADAVENAGNRKGTSQRLKLTQPVDLEKLSSTTKLSNLAERGTHFAAYGKHGLGSQTPSVLQQPLSILHQLPMMQLIAGSDGDASRDRGALQRLRPAQPVDLDRLSPATGVPDHGASHAHFTAQTVDHLVKYLDKAIESRAHETEKKQVRRLDPIRQSIEDINTRLRPERIVSDEVVRVVLNRLRNHIRDERSRMGILG